MIDPIGRKVRISSAAVVCSGMVGQVLGMNNLAETPNWFRKFKFQMEDGNIIPVYGSEIDGFYEGDQFVPLNQYLERE